MATVAIQRTPGPCLVTVAGPLSHSPPPMDAASMIAPGPMILNALRTENGNGSGSSATSQGGNLPREVRSLADGTETPEVDGSVIGEAILVEVGHVAEVSEYWM